MKKMVCALSLGILLVSQIAHAQSSITLYGIIDDGLTWSSNTCMRLAVP